MGMLVALQRMLIYVPDRDASLPPAVSGLVPGRVHSIEVDTADNLKLHGWHVLPPDAGLPIGNDGAVSLDSDRPLVLFLPGNGGNRSWRSEELDLLARMGADVFLFDYRGYGDNPGKPSEEGLATDARAAWRYATEVRGVPPERIVLLGESLGGGVATRLAWELSRAGTPPGGLILKSTFDSLVETARHLYPWLPVRWALVDRFPSVDRIPEVTSPLLVIHGRRDRIVPFERALILFAAAPEASISGVPKKFAELPAANHNDILSVERPAYANHVQEFLDLVREKQGAEVRR